MPLTPKQVQDWKTDKESGWLVEPNSGKLVNPETLDIYDFSDQEPAQQTKSAKGGKG